MTIPPITNAAQIRILIADDHPIVRDGLIAILGTQPDFTVVGECGAGVEAVRLVTELRPDIVLLDLDMPEMDGVSALLQMHEQVPGVRVIVLTAFDTDDQIVGAVRAGAKGYLLKGVPRDEIFNAIRVVHAGGSLLQPIVTSKLMLSLEHDGQSQTPPVELLTERESEVLRLLAQGKTNKEIASALYISERTVKFHVSAIMGKLGAGNRTEAVAAAAQRGLVKLS